MWYSAGTVNVTNGQRLVTGNGTDFVANVLSGQGFIVGDKPPIEIEQVISATQLMLRTAWLGASGTIGYSIIPTQSLMKDLADRAAELIGSFASVRDGIGAGLMGDGVQAAPGLRFATDQDTGIRRYADNAIGLVTAGLDRLVLNNSGGGFGVANDGKAGVIIQGLDQVAANMTDDGDHKASLYLRAIASGSGAGGSVLFGTTFGNERPFAAIKGSVRNGDNNSTGDLIFSLRAATNAVMLTERARLTEEGLFGLGESPSHQLAITGAGQAANALSDAGSKYATLYIRDTTGQVGAGGALALGTAPGKPLVALKASLADGAGNSIGHLMLSTRGATADATLLARWSWSFDGHYRPYDDNAYDIGAGSVRVRQIYGANGAINTSDVRTKQQVEAIPDEWLDAWGDVRHVRFKFNTAVEEKGDAARWHVGYIAQEILDAFAARDLDATKIGLLCHDEWEERREPEYRTETRTKRTPRAIPSVGGLLDAAGNPLVTWTYDEEPEEVQVATGNMIVTREAGDLWSIRPDQCAAIEAAWQRREIGKSASSLTNAEIMITALLSRIEALEAA
ncbi:tail fiber domain-containing protein [Sphingobium sp. YG1]|uniref:tail fiber domain-containing protein n=1 Tax=Sphingobium sp. YG1 TaxID=2082188 RepID=UPI000DBB2213|nr:tail fiber domain-containing protein [Sphingobium sp. YG1]BBD01829.1 hypothetical protein YGS_C1P3084 [Sphingobium sp. YG1]